MASFLCWLVGVCLMLALNGIWLTLFFTMAGTFAVFAICVAIDEATKDIIAAIKEKKG